MEADAPMRIDLPKVPEMLAEGELPPKLKRKETTHVSFGFLSASMKDNLYALRGGRLIYTSPWIKESPLRRYSAIIALTAREAPFEIVVESGTKLYQAAAIRPRIERALRAEKAGIISFQFDPSHPDFPRFRRLPAPGVLALQRNLFNRLDDEIQAAYRGKLTSAAASDLFERVAAIVVPRFPRTNPIDRRVAKVITLVWENHRLSLAELAAAVGISYYRLSRLFAENIGITLRSYLLWRKVRKAISLSKYGYSLTKIAYDAGFTDPAHFCRIFQQLHAAPPSYFFQSGNVRIIAPSAKPVEATE